MNMQKNPTEWDKILTLRNQISIAFSQGMERDAFRLSALIDEIQLRIWKEAERVSAKA